MSPVTFVIIPCYYVSDQILQTGIAAANSSHIKYFDNRGKYDLRYTQLLKVKEAAFLPFAELAQKLIILLDALDIYESFHVV